MYPVRTPTQPSPIQGEGFEQRNLVESNGWDRYRLANPDEFEDYVRHGFPMGRLGTAEEIADVVVFIASSPAYCRRRRRTRPLAD